MQASLGRRVGRARAPTAISHAALRLRDRNDPALMTALKPASAPCWKGIRRRQKRPVPPAPGERRGDRFIPSLAGQVCPDVTAHGVPVARQAYVSRRNPARPLARSPRRCRSPPAKPATALAPPSLPRPPPFPGSNPGTELPHGLRPRSRAENASTPRDAARGAKRADPTAAPSDRPRHPGTKRPPCHAPMRPPSRPVDPGPVSCQKRANGRGKAWTRF